MQENQKAPVVVSIAGLSGRKRKQEIKRAAKEVTKDKQFKKAVRRVSKKHDTKIPKKLRDATVRAAVEATVNMEAEKAANAKQKRSALETYTRLVARFAAARKKNQKRRKKIFKIKKKSGFKPKKGLYVLKKAEKVTLEEKAKPLEFGKSKK